jgi:hypothetical protein
LWRRPRPNLGFGAKEIIIIIRRRIRRIRSMFNKLHELCKQLKGSA